VTRHLDQRARDLLRREDKSTKPVAMAARGMASCRAVSGRCAIVMPPAAFTSASPADPSAAEPESTTAMARSRADSASEVKNTSMTAWLRASAGRGPSRITGPSSRSSVFGGMTYTRSAANRVPSVAATTGIADLLPRSSGSALAWCGERCCTSTIAMPGSGGRQARTCPTASSPPAEAPMPTTVSPDDGGVVDAAFPRAPAASGTRSRPRFFPLLGPRPRGVDAMRRRSR
jgi:hypothetical protein